MTESREYTAPSFEAIRAGDNESRRRAFDVFVAPRRSQMVGLAKSQLVGSVAKQYAEDAVQYALLSTWNILPRMREDSDLAGYISTAVVRRATTFGIRATRDQKHLKPEDITDIGSDSIVANDGATAEDISLEDASYVDLVDTLKANMSEDFVEALILHEVGGFHYEEIARQKGIAVGTVKSRISRAKRDARKVLEQTDR